MGTWNNGVYTSADGTRTFRGDEAKKNAEYDRLRSSGRMEEAEAYGKQVHNDMWEEKLKRNNEEARNRPSVRQVGTTNPDGSYTTADGTRTFQGKHAAANRKYDELLNQGKQKEAEDYGKKVHDVIAKCKSTRDTLLIEMDTQRKENCPSEPSFFTGENPQR